MSEAERILLFWKDDEDIMMMFSHFFQEHGYLVDSVESDEKCFEFCEATPPHVLIVNRSFWQPNITLKFIRKLRSQQSLSLIPIIVGNANVTQDGHLESFKAGANACFGSVFDIANVLQQVRILIEDPTKTNLVDKNIARMYGDSKAD